MESREICMLLSSPYAQCDDAEDKVYQVALRRGLLITIMLIVSQRNGYGLIATNNIALLPPFVEL